MRRLDCGQTICRRRGQRRFYFIAQGRLAKPGKSDHWRLGSARDRWRDCRPEDKRALERSGSSNALDLPRYR